MASNVAAGAHTVTIGWKSTSANIATVFVQSDRTTGAIFLGG